VLNTVCETFNISNKYISSNLFSQILCDFSADLHTVRMQVLGSLNGQKAIAECQQLVAT